MKHTKLIAVLSLILALVMVMSACATATQSPDATNTPEATETVIPTATPTAIPTEAPTPTPTEEPTPTPEPTPAPTPIPQDMLVSVYDKIDTKHENTFSNIWQWSTCEDIEKHILNNNLYYPEQYDDGRPDDSHQDIWILNYHMTEAVEIRGISIECLGVWAPKNDEGVRVRSKYNAPEFTVEDAVVDELKGWAAKADPNEQLTWEFGYYDENGEFATLYYSENDPAGLDLGKIDLVTWGEIGAHEEYYIMVYNSPARNDEGYRCWIMEGLDLWAMAE